MNKIFKICALLFVCLAAFACTKTDALSGDEGELLSKKVRLNVSAASIGQVDEGKTRVSLKDNGESGIAVSWTEGDNFSIYDEAGAYVGEFVYKGIDGETSGEFEQGANFSMAAGRYTAVYPAADRHSDLADRVSDMDEVPTDLSQSEAAGMTHIASPRMMRMIGEFDYDPMSFSPASFTFMQPYSMLKVEFQLSYALKPTKLVLRNGGENEYTHYFSLPQFDTSGLYTAYFQVKSNDLVGQRFAHYTITFDNEEVKHHTISTDVRYLAGEVYSDNLGVLNDYQAIYTAEELQAINTDDNTRKGKYILANDIDLKDFVWTPINEFYGTFNGNNKTISNLSISGGADRGLFGYAQDAEIFNLKMKNVTIGTIDDIGERFSYGAVAGVSHNSTIRNISVEDVTIHGTTRLGGAIGVLYDGKNTIENVSVKTVTIHSIGTEDTSVYFREGIGGVIGCINKNNIAADDSERQTINNISADGVTISVESAEDMVGGAIGNLYNANADNIVASNVGITTGTGTTHVGGVVGLIEDSMASGIKSHMVTITAAEDNVGGTVGSINDGSTITGIISKNATLTATEKNNVGGAVGQIGIGNNIYEIQVQDAVVKGQNNLGGAVGYIKQSMLQNSVVNNVEIEGNGGIGGIIGKFEGTDGDKYEGIVSCYLKGDYKIKAGHYDVGGIVGFVGDTRMVDCNTLGVSDAADNVLSGLRSIGGIVGAGFDVDAVACANAINKIATITGEHPTGFDEENMGGIFGYLEGANSHIVACYNIGGFKDDDTERKKNVGGIVGYIPQKEFTNNILIQACYSYDNISLGAGESVNVGEIVGSVLSGNLTINDCLYDGELSGMEPEKLIVGASGADVNLTQTGVEKGIKGMSNSYVEEKLNTSIVGLGIEGISFEYSNAEEYFSLSVEGYYSIPAL